MAKIPVTWNGKDAQGKPLLWDSGLTWDGTLPQPTSKTMQIRVSIGFATGTDHTVEETASAVGGKLYGNPLYLDPIPISQVDIQSALTAFSAAIPVAGQGGPADTATKNSLRDALVGLLRQLAAYVQVKCNNDLATLLSSGFEAVSTNRASTPLAQPTIKAIINGMSGQLVPSVYPIANTRVYELRYALLGPGGAPGPWQSASLYTDSRSMPVGGLTPGQTYQFQIRAVGGSTGYSDWSDPVSHMSM